MKEFSVEEVREMVRAGEICDMKTAAGTDADRDRDLWDRGWQIATRRLPYPLPRALQLLHRPLHPCRVRRSLCLVVGGVSASSTASSIVETR